MPTDKVYLVGFMGAGKTTLARRLAARLDWRVEDIDDPLMQKVRYLDKLVDELAKGRPMDRILRA